MVDPVFASDGITYERDAIQRSPCSECLSLALVVTRGFVHQMVAK